MQSTDDTVQAPTRRERSDVLRAADGRSVQIGRYVVIREIGSGAMGLVLAAYDPDLERKVALKILRERGGSAGALRMRREAQAMARLSHPNVAQVYEVAEDGGRLFLAMEHIEGTTLRGWLHAAPRPWREVLRVYVEAGRGLAAAHAAGLLHRDFKPDNAMLAADGRVRVLDFGLSRLCQIEDGAQVGGRVGGMLEMNVTGAGSLVGTPAYMSPEQFEREEIDARSDQFSFCVALWEALHGQRPYAGDTVPQVTASMRRGELAGLAGKTRVPAWVRRVLGRGLAVEPSQRFPTMEALLAALSRDPQRTRTRWLAAAVGVVAIAGASYGLAAHRVAEAQVCSGAADELIGAWDGELRGAVERAIGSTGVVYAERSTTAIGALLDGYAQRWVDVHASSCASHQRGHMSPQLFDRRMACLRQRKSELAATTAVLGQTTRETVAQAVDTARGLPAVALCEDDERLLADVASPADAGVAATVEEARGRLARLQALERTGRYTEALAEALPMVAEAERLGFLPYLAEVHLLTGKLQLEKVQPEQARRHLDRALELAIEARVDDLAAEAMTLAIFVIASAERRPDEALLRVPLAWALVRRIGEPPLVAARLHNSVGAAYHERDDEAHSIGAYAQALELLVVHAPDDPLRWATVNNLAVSLDFVGQHARAGALARAGLEQLEREYDVCHPHAAALQIAVAANDAATGAMDRGIAGYERALACFASEYPAYALITLHELGTLHLLRGDEAQTRRQLARADELLARFPDARPRAGEIELLRADVAIHAGAPLTARSVLEAMRGQAAAAETDLGLRVDARLGSIAHDEHDDERALELLERAAPLLAPDHQNSERGLYAFALARTLRALGRAPERVARLAAEAVTAYETAGAQYAGRVAEIRAWQSSGP